MNICMVGYGMMGVWHSDALQGEGCRFHTLVGRRPEQSQEFAERYGYQKWTADLDEALADPQVQHLDMVREVPHPKLGSVKLIDGGVTLSDTPTAIRSAAPGHGEHTEEILARIGRTPGPKTDPA